MKNHPLYEQAYRAHYNTSHVPDQRAVQYLKGYEAQLAQFKKLCGDDIERFEDIKVKYTAKFTNHLNAKSRCLSPMITGPANFPLARAEKANASERKRAEELYSFVEKVEKRLHKDNNPNESGVIKSDDKNALQALRDKLKTCQQSQETMKLFNKLVRAGASKEEITEKTGLSLKDVENALKPDFCGRVGFPAYTLTNNNAEIKRLQARIQTLESVEGRENKESVIEGIRVLENYEDMRLQLFFEGKPGSDTRSLLKSNGFKWSPKNGCWQRLLNNNAIYSFKNLFLEKYRAL